MSYYGTEEDKKNLRDALILVKEKGSIMKSVYFLKMLTNKGKWLILPKKPINTALLEQKKDKPFKHFQKSTH